MAMSPVSSAIRLLTACATFAALVFATGSTRTAAQSESASPHLLARFTGQSPRG